jgi:3-oxoacyl-[acyl-carrier protein] reductase
MSKLEGKIALVTGSSRGIGAAIAKKFGEEGAHVIINFRKSKEEADKVAQSIIRKGGSAETIMADVSSEEQVREMFLEIKNKHKRLDILVNNAGLSDGAIWNLPLEDTDIKTVQRVFSVDSFGTFLCSKFALGLMKRGSIVNISSLPALVGDREGIVYAFAKGSVISLTKMLAKYLAPKIRVNCMILGSFRTSWIEWLSEKQLKEYVKSIPLGRLGTPEEAANVALFLASDDSSFITGQSIVVDGGEAMR